MQSNYFSRNYTTWGVLLCVLLLSLISVFNQVKTIGLGWQEKNYVPRLEAVALGQAESPWQYRILSDVPAYGLCQLFEYLNVPRGTGVALVLIRVVQNFVIGLLALAYYRRLGIPIYLGLLGISMMAWSMTQANYQSYLAINTYTDIILYLCAGLVILHKKVWLILTITTVAAANRETSGLIPVMLLAVWFAQRNSSDEDMTEATTTSQSLWAGLNAMVAYAIVMIGLRLALGSRPWSVYPDIGAPGWEMLQFNFASEETWYRLFWTLSIIPVLALASWRFWPPVLKAFFWAIVPVWFATHFLFGQIAETRLILVPHIMVFIPGFLCGVLRWHESNAQLETRSESMIDTL